MKKQIKLKDVKAAAEATAAVAILVAVLTIMGELWHPLKDTLKAVFTHHWLGKGFLSILMFAIVYKFRRNNYAHSESAAKALHLAVAASLAASAAMLIFFVLLLFFLLLF